MKKLDINQLEQISGGGCKEMAVIASVGAVLAVVTLNPWLMGACYLISAANAYENC